MNPTLAEVLAYEPFRRASAQVVAGEGALGRHVRWVHISEMPYPARLFRGGELLLTQGRTLSGDPAGQRRWVRELAEANLAAVAVEVGVVLPTLPSSLVAEARRTGLPLIVLQHPAYFMDMTEAVHSAIINRQYSVLYRVERIHREFSGMVMQGASLRRMIEELARITGNPVVLADQARQVVEFAPDTPELAEQLREWQAHARIGHSTPPDGSAADSTARPACTWVPIVVRGEMWGSIHVLHLAGRCDEVERMALDGAAGAIGLAYTAVADVERREEDARGALVHDLLRRNYSDPGQAHRRAVALGVELARQLRVVVCRPLEIWDIDERGVRRLGRKLRVVGGLVRRTLSADRPLVGYDGSQVVAVVRDRPTSSRVVDRCTEVVQQCASSREAIQLVVGVSDPADLAGLPRAYTDAEDAVRYAIRSRREPGVLLSADLGINRLLVALDDSGVLTRHIERELGAVLDHDAKTSAPLLPTLAAYLRLSGRKSEVARALGIERRSLYYRLERLQKLVNGPLHDPDVQVRLLIALRGLDFRQPGAGSGRAMHIL